MRVDWAIPCRFVEVQQPYGATIIGAGADVVIAPHVPVPVQVLFAVRYVGGPDEMDGESSHAIACRIFSPGGLPSGEQVGVLKARATSIVSGYVAEIIVPAGVVVDAREYGTYHIEFGIDDDVVRVPLHIVAPEEASQ